MAKRYTDTTIWKKQRWFKKLSPLHKLAWMYITDMCDHAGILKMDFSEFIDDLGIEEFDMKEFTDCCNIEYDKENGKKIFRERIKLVQKSVFWITGFIRFQYENKQFLINPAIPAVYSALTVLDSYGILTQAIDKGYITLSQPFLKGDTTTKDKDKDKDKKNEGGEGGNDLVPPTINEKLLIPQMLATFKVSNPNFPCSMEKDFKPLQSIAVFINEQSKKNGSHIENKDYVISKWAELSAKIAKDKFYSKKTLSTISNHIQEIYQLNTDGTNKAKTSNTGRSMEFDKI